MPTRGSAGESVAEERHPGDTPHCPSKGKISITPPEGAAALRTGDVFCVPAGANDAIEPATTIKLLQISA